jgi:uncharacterized integral membrane protein
MAFIAQPGRRIGRARWLGGGTLESGDGACMRILVWLFRAAVFFVLFTFSLNNQHGATVQWFFGHEWHAPMAVVLLAAFAVGCAVGVVAMLPGAWRRQRGADRSAAAPPPAAAAVTPRPAATAPAPLHPPREGL